jgi:DNA-binding MarR family transcriptional regulator
MLDYLVNEGLIERRVDSRDRRSVLFERTHAGKRFLERIAKPGTKHDEISTLTHGLNRRLPRRF